MSSKLVTEIVDVGLIAAAIAVNVIPGVGQVLSAAMITAITGAGIAAGLSLTESVLIGPGKLNTNSALNNQVGRLYATLETTAPRKIAFGGPTALATDVRYDTYTGSKQEHYHQIICVAAHKVHSIDEIWIDNEKAWTSAGGVQGRYVGFLTVATVLEGNSTNGIAIDSTWTSSCTLTGCAYVHLDYLLIGPDKNTSSPFQGGLSNRMTIRGKGALVYDPRLDSTVPGGSGTMRADDQTTWAWDDNASRNPALQELFYELGWKINGKLSVGKGVPAARLALADYITAANICDEAVNLKSGAWEYRYRSDGVVSEGDAPKSVRDAICSTMNAELRDNGAGVSLQIFYNDLADISCDFDGDDIIGEGAWIESQALNQYKNIVRGRCVDPSDAALYQLTDYPEWSTTSPDGIDRVDSFELPMVQSATQAQRLAKLRGTRAQFQGRYSPTLGPRAWRTGIGRNVTFTHPVLPWSGKVLRTVAQKISRGGPTQITLQEEDASIYAWDPATEEKTALTAGLPTIYNPSNNPLLPGVADETTLITQSYVTGLTFSIDTSGNITISNHQRVYADKTVSVTGATVAHATSAAAGDVEDVYYDDPGRAGGAVTYQVLRLAGGTGDASTAFPSPTNPSRHFVCAGHVPASGSTSGGSNVGSGGGTAGYGGATSIP